MPAPKDDRARLDALEEYQILDTAEEPLYDAFTALAREITGTPISTITLIDEHRAWYKSHLGIDGRESPREESFCAHVVEAGKEMIVGDARDDKRFSDNPNVTGEPFVRFYAGVPLTSPEGYTIGTLCVVDSKPRTLEHAQLRALERLGATLISVLDGRRRFLSLFDAAHIDVFTIDPKSGAILFASRGACRRAGYSRKELVGMPIYDLMPSIGDRLVRDLIVRARRGVDVFTESRFVRGDGSSYPVEIRLDLTRENGDERVLVIATDVTDRKEREREINLLMGAMNAAGDAIIVYTVTDAGELVVSYVNDAYQKQSGYSSIEAIGKPFDFFRQSMPDDEGMHIVRSGLSHGIPVEAEIVSYRKDGSTYWNAITLHPILDAEGGVAHWISVERDITEEVNRTSALAEEHDRLVALTRAARRIFTALDTFALVSTLRDVVSQLLGAEARVLAVRDDGLSVEVDEIGAINWDGGVHDPIVARAVTERLRVMDESDTRAVAYTARVGEARYVLDIRTPVPRTLRGTDLFVFDLIAEYFAVAARNVSLYHELDERRSAVLELNQTKSDLITMLAHDFRGPLTSIVGFADLTSEVGDVNSEQSEFLETIKRSAMQLSDLATDTLTLSRLERNEVALALGEVDVGELVRAIAYQSSDRRQVKLEIHGDASVTGDEERLRQVFANLIDNAIKYSPDGGDPEVRVEGADDAVTVTIRDFGIGIPAGEISRVFDRFTRASNARKARISGTGFGLFLTKQLVQLHGGTIAVDSEEGRGSTFIVKLPRRVDRRAAPRTVVVMDPERDRSFLAYGLQEAGYRVITVISLEEVLGIADAQPPDVLVVTTPEDLSRAASVQVRAFSRESKVPVIAIGESKTELGALVTLQRPVLIGDVVTALERLLS